ncbi:MAG TPA: alkaline phosphatase family protein [Vicinamibacteria bacterium]|nr:alkaline phosphatase family protein [Vicinamibacteria bacterium]
MRSLRRLGPAWGLVALGLWACGSLSSSSPTPLPTPTPAPSPKVAIISIDGLRPDALVQAAAPTIQGLARRGAYTFQAQTVLPSATLPGHASMLSGYEPSVHRLTWGDYKPEKGTITVPTIFTIAREAGLRTAMVIGKDKLAHLNAPGTVDRYVLTAAGDAAVANEAVVQAAAGFDLLFVHFPQTDYAGHGKGWMSATYLQQIAETDQAVSRVLLALPPETTVILTADHGGYGTTHGSSAPLETTIPWIIVGPRIPARGQLSAAIRTTDTAATALYVLGLSLRSGATGKPATEAFGEQAAQTTGGMRTLLAATESPTLLPGPAGLEPPATRPERSRERRQAP